MEANAQPATAEVEMCGYTKGSGMGCFMLILGIALLPFWGVGIIFIIIGMFMSGGSKKIYRCSACKNPVASTEVRVCPSCHVTFSEYIPWMIKAMVDVIAPPQNAPQAVAAAVSIPVESDPYKNPEIQEEKCFELPPQIPVVAVEIPKRPSIWKSFFKACFVVLSVFGLIFIALCIYVAMTM